MKKVVVATLVFLMTGCSSRIGDFTIASTKNINVKDGVHYVDEGSRTQGKDINHFIFIFPTKFLGPNVKQAMDNAIEKKPGAVGLSNVVVHQGSFYIPFLYGQEWFTIVGNPIYEHEWKPKR